MLSLEAREQLHSLYQRLKFGSAEWQDCVSWAIERLQQDEEGEDLDIVLLAAATSGDEVPALFQQIADRHLAPEALTDDLAAGKHLVRLHQAYRDGQETVATLEPQLCPANGTDDPSNSMGVCMLFRRFSGGRNAILPIIQLASCTHWHLNVAMHKSSCT